MNRCETEVRHIIKVGNLYLEEYKTMSRGVLLTPHKDKAKCFDDVAKSEDLAMVMQRIVNELFNDGLRDVKIIRYTLTTEHKEDEQELDIRYTGTTLKLIKAEGHIVDWSNLKTASYTDISASSTMNGKFGKLVNPSDEENKN